MKTFFAILVWCLFLVGCAATKTTINDQSKIVEDHDSVAMVKESACVQIDTTKVSDTQIRITEIEFFTPGTKPRSETEPRTRPDQMTAEKDHPPDVPVAQSPQSPPIKKIKITEVGTRSKESGQVVAMSDRKDSLKATANIERDIDLRVKEKPIDPFVWRSIAVVATIIFSLAAVWWIRKKL